MRTGIVLILTVATLCIAPVRGSAADAVAVDSANGPVVPLNPATLSGVERDVLAADASWGKAYQTCDLALMDRVLHPDILFVHLHARVDHKPAMMKEFSGCPNEYTLTEPIRVLMLGTGQAVVEGNIKLRAKGQKNLMQILYTRVYSRTAAGWQMVAHQSTLNPGLDAAGKPLPNPALGGGASALP